MRNNSGLLVLPPQKWNRFGICRSKVRILERINIPHCSVCWDGSSWFPEMPEFSSSVPAGTGLIRVFGSLSQVYHSGWGFREQQSL